jgi:hypothetical protein
MMAASNVRWRARLTLGATVTGMLALALTGGTAAPALARAPAAAAPSPSLPSGQLFSVSADSASDAWAVGSYAASDGDYDSLIVHWDGTAWAQVPSPSPSSVDNTLFGVSAVSASDVWAVGREETPSGAYDTLILHWDGTAWTQVPSPSPSSSINFLNGVSAVSGNDAWAVGEAMHAHQKYHTLTLHWDGTAWTQVNSPHPGHADGLNGVSAVSGNDVWAAGYVIPHKTGGHPTLALHWDGAAWSRVYTPNPSQGGYVLNSVSADSASDAWTAGNYQPGGGVVHTLFLHWNGKGWSRVNSPNPTRVDWLFAVSADSPSDAWAVGYYESSSPSGDDTLTLHWDGTAWTKVPSPNPSSAMNVLEGVSAVSPSDAWAVGYTVNPEQPLILHWNGTAWTTS